MGTGGRGIIIFAHGSSVPSANDAVRAVAAAAQDAAGLPAMEVAFLGADPRLEEAVARLAPRVSSQILVVPYFLTLGIHLQRDLPGIVAQISQNHEDIEIRVTPPLDGHKALAGILVERAVDGFASWV